MRTQVRLDTLSSVNKFVEVVSRIPEQIWLEDGNSMRVSAKSILACLYSLEWSRIFVVCDRNIDAYIMPWIA